MQTVQSHVTLLTEDKKTNSMHIIDSVSPFPKLHRERVTCCCVWPKFLYFAGQSMHKKFVKMYINGIPYVCTFLY